jgi:hypothetical protein
MGKITLTMEHDEASEFFAFTTVGIKNVLDAANAFKRQGGDVGNVDAQARRAMELMKFALLTATMSDDK